MAKSRLVSRQACATRKLMGAKMIVPVILSGGSGTRLWPLSRQLHPKQLLPFVSARTMLQETVARLSGIHGISAPVVVSNEEHRFMIAEQLRLMEVQPAAILLEPQGRNTAPAAAAAALHAASSGKDPVLLVLPADHVIRDLPAFRAVVLHGAGLARHGKLVVFGIIPRNPETGYGYIKRGQPIAPGLDAKNSTARGMRQPAFIVERFEEKPKAQRARAFVKSGDYLWNSGMFMFRASTFLRELASHAPDILAACRKAYAAARADLEFLRLDRDAFDACRSDSIDYAVMEKTSSSVVVPLDAGWSDVGSWSSLWEVRSRDAQGNAVAGDVIIRDSSNSFVHAGSRLVAGIGLRDLVVIETADAVLVAHRNDAQKVKDIVAELLKNSRPEATLHRRVNRPWGAYECIDSAERFQVKRITVSPGARLSLQKHMHRAEHWIVVRGTARIVRGKETLTLTENQSTYIPLGVTHRLENPGKIPLELIEVQSGSYLGEDDIVRFEDSYGRSGKQAAKKEKKKT